MVSNLHDIDNNVNIIKYYSIQKFKIDIEDVCVSSTQLNAHWQQFTLSVLFCFVLTACENSQIYLKQSS